MKQYITLQNILKVLFGIFIISLPFQTRLVYFTQNSHLGSNFLFYNTLFLYASDVILVLLGIFLAYGMASGRFHVKLSRTLEYLMWFVIIVLVSMIVSRETINEIQLFGSFKLFLVIILLITTTIVFSNESKKFHVKHIVLWLILAISVTQGVIAIIQYFSQESIGLGFFGEEYLRTYLPGVAKFQIPGAERWIFDRFFNVSHGTNLVMRPYGTFSHPNVFGAFMFFSSLISLYLLNVSRETWKRGVVVVILFFQIFCGFLSFSRVAVVAWIIALIIWFVLVSFTRNMQTNPQQVVFGGMSLKKILISTLLAAGISIALLFPQYLDRGGVVSYGTTNQEAISDRSLYQKISWEMIKTRPLVGIGFQSFALQMDNFSPVRLENHQHQPVHNIYLLIAAETGLLGLAFFLAFVIFVLKAGWRNRFDMLSTTFFTLFAMMLIIGLFDHYPITIQQGRLMLFLSAGVILGLNIYNNKGKESHLQRSLPLPN